MSLTKLKRAIGQVRDLETLTALTAYIGHRREVLAKQANQRARDEAWAAVKAAQQGDRLYSHGSSKQIELQTWVRRGDYAYSAGPKSWVTFWALPIEVLWVRPRRRELVVKANGCIVPLNQDVLVRLDLRRAPAPEALTEALGVE